MQLVRAIALVLLFALESRTQTLPLPERRMNALTGDRIAESLSSLPSSEREARIQNEILAGNVPDFLRRLYPVTVTNAMDGNTNVATFFVTSDYLAVGTDADCFLAPMTPMTAQVIADQLDCTLPTRKMADAIYSAAGVKLAPSPIPPSEAMTTVPVFQQHNTMIRTQRITALAQHPVGALVAGHKKDVVLTPRLNAVTNKVAIYGWHQTNGTPIQPIYLGHTAAWVDYSHGIRLVQRQMIVNGETTSVARVLADPKLADLLSDEGVIASARYPTNSLPAPDPAKALPPTSSIEFKPSAYFQERVATFNFDPEMRIQINAPRVEDFDTGKPVMLILYALPNGNTIEQTVGKRLKPGDDWHFDIQHIGAQTRFLRAALTNQILVVAYLEAEMKSWPAWRRKHGDKLLPDIIAQLKSTFPTNQIEVVLTGHSGGGSFTFGYLNTQERIPDDVARIAFLDSNYAYETTNHFEKLAYWLRSSSQHALGVLAYQDSVALLDGKTFVSERGGTWGRSHAMLRDLGAAFPFASSTNSGLQIHLALNGRVQILLKENPEKKILHTVQVERNGFIHAILFSTPYEGKSYDYLGERAYTTWIQSE